MKKLELALLLGLAASICCSSLAKTADSRSKLEENVLRLHVLANSDSIDDQALKLKVRDKVLTYAGELLTHPGESLEAVEEIITEHLEELEKVAADSVREEDYDYPVQAKLVNMSFDDRTYGNLTMPAGEYDALRITIGKAEGQNWWCVMYPALCVPNAWSADGDRQTEQTSFDEAQQDLLEHPEQYRVKLKCVEWLEHMTARLHNVFENE